MTFLPIQEKILLLTSDNTFHKLLRHGVKLDPYTEKSSIKTSMISSIIYVIIDNIHLWKVAGDYKAQKASCGMRNYHMDK